MKEHLHRVLPYAAIVLDLVVLWANVTDNDFVTLDNLKFQIFHFTGHLVDVRLYDWIFDFLQSLPEKYSDFTTESLTEQLTEKLNLHYWHTTDIANCTTWLIEIKIPDCLYHFGTGVENDWNTQLLTHTLIHTDEQALLKAIIEV